MFWSSKKVSTIWKLMVGFGVSPSQGLYKKVGFTSAKLPPEPISGPLPILKKPELLAIQNFLGELALDIDTRHLPPVQLQEPPFHHVTTGTLRPLQSPRLQPQICRPAPFVAHAIPASTHPSCHSRCPAERCTMVQRRDRVGQGGCEGWRRVQGARGRAGERDP